MIKVFATHEIDCIEMEAEEVVVIKVLTQPDNEDFYVHVIRRNTNLEEGAALFICTISSFLKFNNNYMYLLNCYSKPLI